MNVITINQAAAIAQTAAGDFSFLHQLSRKKVEQVTYVLAWAAECPLTYADLYESAN